MTGIFISPLQHYLADITFQELTHFHIQETTGHPWYPQVLSQDSGNVLLPDLPRGPNLSSFGR